MLLSYPSNSAVSETFCAAMQDKPAAADVDTTLLARGTPGFSGAELCNLVNEAALLAARGDAEQISARLLDEACDKIRMGVERKCALS